MITKFTFPDLDKVIDSVKNREIDFVKIIKRSGDYYIEYSKGKNNNSTKILDLLVILEDFKESMKRSSLSDFYLYYNKETDEIIHNVNEICDDNSNSETSKMYDTDYDAKVEILNNLNLAKKRIAESTLDKITLSEGKKRFNTTYEKVIDKLISDIKTNL